MVICLDTLSCLTCRRKIEMALWVIWIELDFSGEFCDVGLSWTTYTRKPGLRFFENFRKSKHRSKFFIWFLGITHQGISLEKLWAIRKNWSCPEILDGYRKSLLKRSSPLGWSRNCWHCATKVGWACLATGIKSLLQRGWFFFFTS